MALHKVGWNCTELKLRISFRESLQIQRSVVDFKGIPYDIKPTTLRWICSDSWKDILSLSSEQFHPTLCKATPIDGSWKISKINVISACKRVKFKYSSIPIFSVPIFSAREENSNSNFSSLSDIFSAPQKSIQQMSKISGYPMHNSDIFSFFYFQLYSKDIALRI